MAKQIEFLSWLSFDSPTAHQTTSTSRLCWGDCVSINRIYVDADNALPEEERQPAQQKHAHDDAQGASRFVFGTPSLSRSHGATWMEDMKEGVVALSESLFVVVLVWVGI